jgi:hypothetical protein
MNEQTSAPTIALPRRGGCLCGAVRYEVDRPFLAVVTCHCRNCQKQAGSAVSIIAVAKLKSVAVTGNLSVYEDHADSGRPVYRKFCGRCGSPVFTDTPAAEAQGLRFIKAGTLDDVSDLRPSAHYWTISAQPWFPFTDGVTCLERE